jgi:hypothetical protein
MIVPCLPEILCLWAGELRNLWGHNIKHLAKQIRRGNWARRRMPAEWIACDMAILRKLCGWGCTIHRMPSEDITLQGLIEQLWVAPENAEWTPKTHVLPLDQVKCWMQSPDIEVLGFTDAMIHDGRFRIEPPLAVADYVAWVKHYCGRCFRENPGGDWSDSSYSAGWELVGIFTKLWDDDSVPREFLCDLKAWLAALYEGGDQRLRTCIVNATLEHLFERTPIRKYFSDWRGNALLRPAYDEACLWDRKTPLSR